MQEYKMQVIFNQFNQCRKSKMLVAQKKTLNYHIKPCISHLDKMSLYLMRRAVGTMMFLLVYACSQKLPFPLFAKEPYVSPKCLSFLGGNDLNQTKIRAFCRHPSYLTPSFG
jgi:hypothetical protein